MPRRTVLVDGQRHRATPGIHIFIDGHPPRLECIIRALRCEICRNGMNIWMTDDWRWRLLPRRWWRKVLCVRCYRAKVG